VNVVIVMVRKLSEVERSQNRQKLGCVLCLCGKIFDGWGQVPLTDRMGAWPHSPLDLPMGYII